MVRSAAFMLGPELDQELIKELAKSGPVVGEDNSRTSELMDYSVHEHLGNVVRCPICVHREVESVLGKPACDG
eukprot:scaffold2102_cov389-Pavlova_lutheri.AAC.1